MRKLKIILLKKLRDMSHKVRMHYAKKADAEAIRMGHCYWHQGLPLTDKRIDFHRKKNVEFTKKSLKWADRVYRYNMRIIKCKAP